MPEMREFCYKCQKVTPIRAESRASGTAYLCRDCGWQVDFDWDEDVCDCEYDEDGGEPTGCCEECETNLYGDEGPLCQQCEWQASMFGGS